MTTILIVDDVSDNRVLLETLFRGGGYSTVSANNGAEALALASASPPDLIVTDIMMPVMDGFELCRQWKRDDRLRTVPLIFYTATYTGSREERLANSLGAERFILKPQQPEVLLGLVREVLDASRSHTAADAPLGAEMEVLRQYNAVLFTKLEKRVQQLHAEIADRRRAEAALQLSEERLLSILSAMRGGVVYIEASGEITGCNPSAQRILGLSESELLGKRLDASAWHVIHEDGTPFTPDAYPASVALRTGAACGDVVMGIHRPDGVLRWVAMDARPLVRPGEARPYAVAVIFNDITDQRAEQAERRKLEQQLRVTQKLEALGRLAGGIAHDFNNVLAVILGTSELALLTGGLPDPIRADFETIHSAAERSSAMTRQLLGFARQQSVSPRALHLNAEIAEQMKLLKRLLGENVAVHWSPGEALWPVFMDASQFDQVLINLCANARDAIRDVGDITVSTANTVVDASFCTAHPEAVPGAFVRVSVADTGSGMSEDVRARIFDPFFTTKDVGKGTGLGLATVYGAVLQSGGFIVVVSALGRGTSFDVYIPRHAEDLASSVASADDRRVWEGHESILVVDDDDFLRRVVARTLKSLGYKVVTADCGAEAHRIAAALGPQLRLVLTDLVMPGVSGLQLASELSALDPKLKVIIMSGYAEMSAVSPPLEVSGAFIAKPFSRESIGRKLREVLDAT